ncbi:hypothetical protein K435DRAFT_879952 [Dendrothele bispora CBS 962.96]|uniref:Uncharacterized protein n=1 Tax=Dendrothele bispora (strain CBS 962.96) TaxID=1314807 RepID=A0A4S8KKL6_DENBC|nr:hypothetical protein K435DRAFT_879952 [Dendrothele bispora CBS 962.96]
MRARQVRTRSGSGITQPLDLDLRVGPGWVEGQRGPGPDIGKTACDLLRVLANLSWDP